MADFDVVEGTPVISTTAEWGDAETALLPSRLNAPRHPHRYFKISGAADSFTIELRATVGGVVLADAALGGRLFTWGWSHYGNGPVPGFVTVAANSARASVVLTRRNTGLWLVRCTRPESGAIILGYSLEL